MPISAQIVYTGLLGYSLKKDFFGEGLNYREVELYNYEFGITDLSNLSDLSLFIENNLRTQLNIFSGDVTISSFQIPADQEQSNSQIRMAKYLTTVEVRKPFVNLTLDNPELLSNQYYYGLSNLFSTSYLDLNNVTESFDFAKGEDGSSNYNHNLSFSLRTGNKTTAQSIAVSILGQDYNITGMGVKVFNSGLASYGNDVSSRNYYSETYDLQNNSFSFSKRKNILPIGASTYDSEIKHSLDMGEDGIVSVTEDINIVGRHNFNQAFNGLDTVMAGSFTRANNFYTAFTGSMSASMDALKSSLLSRRKTYDKDGIRASASLTYSNDPTLGTYYFNDSTLQIQRDESSIVNISDSYNFTLTGSIVTGMDTVSFGGQNIAQIMYATKATSATKCLAAYSSYGFNLLGRSAIALTNYSAKTSNRARQQSIEFKYTDDPDYLVSSLTILATNTPVTTFKKVTMTVDDQKPLEINNEYVIINRPTKTSVLAPAFQSSPGTRSVSLTAVVARPSANLLSAPYVPTSELKALYDLARSRALDRFLLSQPILFAYHLSNLNYGFNSKNEVNLSAEITYTEKQRNS